MSILKVFLIKIFFEKVFQLSKFCKEVPVGVVSKLSIRLRTMGRGDPKLTEFLGTYQMGDPKAMFNF